MSQLNRDRIGIFDLDGSLAMYDAAMLRELEPLRSPGEPPITDLWAAEREPHIKARKDMISKLPGFWRNLEPDERGLEVFHIAERIGYRLIVATKGPASKSLAWAEKHEWCQRHVPAAEPNVVTDKGLVYGRFLYDDYPDYMLAWLANRPRGLGIMPATTGNGGFEHPRVIRFDGSNVPRLERAMIAAFNRQAGQPLENP